MSGFISALIKQRKDAKKAEPNTNARLKEIIDILKKYDFDDGITPESIVNILEDLGPTFVKIGQIASQQAEYIPPEYCDIPELLNELVEYVNTTDDHPLIVAAVVHYQLVTIHPFEDGNGRTARLLSGYILDINGYGFNGIGSLEEYFAYDIEEYYSSLQMDLPALYYSGRNDPPHPEIWINYFLRMVLLYSNRVCELSEATNENSIKGSLSYLKGKEKELLIYLLDLTQKDFTPIEISRAFGVTNKTIITRLAVLVKNGFVVPHIVNERIRSYELSDFARNNKNEIINAIQ